MRLLILLAAVMAVSACTSTYQPQPAVVAPAPAPSAPIDEPVVVTPAPPAQETTTSRQPLPAPDEPASPPPAPPATPSSTLLASVQAAITAGDLERGAALSERALRISPRDAQLWYQLAIIRYRQNRMDEAAGTARRALSFVGNDQILRRQINLLLQQTAAGAAPKAR